MKRQSEHGAIEGKKKEKKKKMEAGKGCWKELS
jgi:hypothetical protein